MSLSDFEILIIISSFKSFLKFDMLLCLVISNHLSSADKVTFILSKEHVQWIKWFEPVWSSRIKYEVIS